MKQNFRILFSRIQGFKFKKTKCVFLRHGSYCLGILNAANAGQRSFYSFAGNFKTGLSLLGGKYRIGNFSFICVRVCRTLLLVSHAVDAHVSGSLTVEPFCYFKTCADPRISEISIMNYNSQKYNSIV